MKTFRNCLVIIAGAFIIGIGLSCFLIPNRIAAGGISGIATVLEYSYNLKPSIVILLLNIPVFIAGIIVLGKKFVLKSMLGTVALSASVEVAQIFGVPTNNELLSAVAGGILVGVGLGFVMLKGASTGGTDLIAHVIKKKMPHFSLGTFILLVDGIIILWSGIVFGNFDLSLYAGVSLYISSKVIDGILEGTDFAKCAYIITSQVDKVTESIINELERGVTGINSKGMYGKRDFTMLMCVLPRNELVKLKNIVLTADKNAFVIFTDVREVYGEGFKKLQFI